MEKITLALAKGRISEAFMQLDSRKLIHETEFARIILVKPVDVPTYVHSGVADIGIVGNDVIIESGKTFYALKQFSFSTCFMAIAGLDDTQSLDGPLTIATKYPNICKKYFPEAKTIFLNGSVELAPLLNLSDAIFDIVETGSTLRENGLKVIKKVLDIEPVLIANTSSYVFKQSDIEAFITRLSEGALNHD